MRAGTLYAGPRIGQFEYGFVTLIPQDEWWVASWNDGREPNIELYVDITTPADWPSESRVVTVDLDLDVVRFRDGRVELVDEDEFEDHRVRFGYPDDVIERAVESARSVLETVTSRTEPFGAAAGPWLEALAGA